MAVDIDEEVTGKNLIDFYFPNFEFRKHQREVIEQIIDIYIEDNNAKIILDAPTGSGKSIIGMVIATILNKHFSKKGYILTSDTFLQQQYENDVDRFDMKFPSVMGMDNYICTENDNIISEGLCKVDNLNVKTMKALPCYLACPYYSKRDKAMFADTSILNYHYWLLQMSNYIKRRKQQGAHSDFGFTPRSFTIFDEAHKIMDILNEHFSPIFGNKIVGNYEKCVTALSEYNIINSKDFGFYHDVYSNFYRYLSERDNVKGDEELIDNLTFLLTSTETVLEKMSTLSERLKLNSEGIELNLKSLKNSYKQLSSFYNSFVQYLRMVKENPSKDVLIYPDKTTKNISYKFYCLDDMKIIKDKFDKYYNFGLFMSATFINHDFYSKYMGFEDVYIIKMPVIFDYSKSPIFYNSTFDMSYGNKHKNIESQVKAIDDIVDNYKSGVIHTGSYPNSGELERLTRHKNKIKTYSSSYEKQILINELKESKDFFIAGPSLIEGIDLKDDISRCQIFMKIPFLNMGDYYIKIKKEQDDTWYIWKTALSFIQGLGRSVRTETDYCDTYILDKGFSRLINSDMIGRVIKKRLKIIGR